MGMGFQFEQHRLGLWDLSWDLKKNFPGKWDEDRPPAPPSRPSSQSTMLFIYHATGLRKSQSLALNSNLLPDKLKLQW